MYLQRGLPFHHLQPHSVPCWWQVGSGAHLQMRSLSAHRPGVCTLLVLCILVSMRPFPAKVAIIVFIRIAVTELYTGFELPTPNPDFSINSLMFNTQSAFFFFYKCIYCSVAEGSTADFQQKDFHYMNSPICKKRLNAKHLFLNRTIICKYCISGSH